jgi:hypothetical protein
MTAKATPSTLLVAATKQSISPARQRLLSLLQTLNFGRIEHLIVRNGEPILDPLPRIIREYKFAGENGARPETLTGDFRLKTQLLDLFQLLDDIGDGTLLVLTVKHGLPFQAELPG